MADRDLSRISVGGHPTGIVGLHPVLKAAAVELQGREDDVIRETLLERLSKCNYIHPKARALYGEAFLREYKKMVGESHGSSDGGALEIRVLGPGCPSCEKMADELRQVVGEMMLAADLEHVRDPLEIAGYGVISVPALVIDGKILSSGLIPSKKRLKRWLQDAIEER